MQIYECTKFAVLVHWNGILGELNWGVINNLQYPFAKLCFGINLKISKLSYYCLNNVAWSIQIWHFVSCIFLIIVIIPVFIICSSTYSPANLSPTLHKYGTVFLNVLRGLSAKVFIYPKNKAITFRKQVICFFTYCQFVGLIVFEREVFKMLHILLIFQFLWFRSFCYR